MASSTILSDNGVTSGTTGIKTTGGNDGALLLQTSTAGGAATTAVTISNTQVVTLANALPVGSGGTGATTLAGANLAVTNAANTFNGTQTVQAAATQDAVKIAGRAGGTSSYASTITPTTLAANRTVTLPDADINFVTGLGVANGGTGAATLTANNVILGNGTSAVQFVAPGSSGNLLTSNGTTWTSAAAPSGYAGASGQTFTGNGTFTIPTGITKVRVQVVGGGGNGGSGGSFGCVDYPGMGGGGGGAAIKYLTGLTPGNTLAVTVGGATGTSSVASGTQIITTVSATGGATGAAATSNPLQGGAGGSGSSGDINITGSNGYSFFGLRTASYGGSTILGGSVNGPVSSANGSAGYAYGGGGSGGLGAGKTGGAGAGGAVIFDW